MPEPTNKEEEGATGNMSSETYYAQLIPNSKLSELGTKFSVDDHIWAMLHTQILHWFFITFVSLSVFAEFLMTIMNCFSNLVELPDHILLALIHFP